MIKLIAKAISLSMLVLCVFAFHAVGKKIDLIRWWNDRWSFMIDPLSAHAFFVFPQNQRSRFAL